MSLQLQVSLDYENLVELVTQLTEVQQKDLIRRMLLQRAEERPLTPAEKIQLLDVAKIHIKINGEPSIRREDWYGDDGR